MAKSQKKPSTNARVPQMRATAKTNAVSTSPARGPRDNSKQAKVIALLRRPGGATIADLVKATGWQSHTVRGAISGALKKRLGLTITSDKRKDSERAYRIAL